MNTKHLLTLFTGLLKHDVQERKEGKENILENECVRVACGLLYVTTKDNNVMSRIVDRIYKHGMEIKISLLKIILVSPFQSQGSMTSYMNHNLVP